MKKILQISNYYEPHIGGIERIAQYLAEGMTNYQTEVVCFGSKDDPLVVNGIRIHRMRVNLKVLGQSISTEFHWRLHRIIDSFQPDVILVHAPNPFVYPSVLRLTHKSTKLAILWHSDIIQQKWSYKIVKSVEERLLKRADAIYATSPIYANHSQQLRKYSDKTAVIPNAIDTDALAFDETTKTKTESLKKGIGKPIIFFVGRHVPYKGIEYLIKAEQMIKTDCQIIIAGQGPLTEELKRSVKSKRISFIGRISDEELKTYLYAADVFAFPSITKNEAFGLALAEAMFCYAVPVTFTIKGSGVNWVSINESTGIEVPNSNVQAFAAAIDRLLFDNELRKTLANNAHQRVNDHFSIEKEVECANQLIGELLK